MCPSLSIVRLDPLTVISGLGNGTLLFDDFLSFVGMSDGNITKLKDFMNLFNPNRTVKSVIHELSNSTQFPSSKDQEFANALKFNVTLKNVNASKDTLEAMALFEKFLGHKLNTSSTLMNKINGTVTNVTAVEIANHISFPFVQLTEKVGFLADIYGNKSVTVKEFMEAIPLKPAESFSDFSSVVLSISGKKFGIYKIYAMVRKYYNFQISFGKSLIKMALGMLKIPVKWLVGAISSKSDNGLRHRLSYLVESFNHSAFGGSMEMVSQMIDGLAQNGISVKSLLKAQGMNEDAINGTIVALLNLTKGVRIPAIVGEYFDVFNQTATNISKLLKDISSKDTSVKTLLDSFANLKQDMFANSWTNISKILIQITNTTLPLYEIDILSSMISNSTINMILSMANQIVNPSPKPVEVETTDSFNLQPYLEQFHNALVNHSTLFDFVKNITGFEMTDYVESIIPFIEQVLIIYDELKTIIPKDLNDFLGKYMKTVADFTVMMKKENLSFQEAINFFKDGLYYVINHAIIDPLTYMHDYSDVMFAIINKFPTTFLDLNKTLVNISKYSLDNFTLKSLIDCLYANKTNGFLSFHDLIPLKEKFYILYGARSNISTKNINLNQLTLEMIDFAPLQFISNTVDHILYSPEINIIGLVDKHLEYKSKPVLDPFVGLLQAVYDDNVTVETVDKFATDLEMSLGGIDAPPPPSPSATEKGNAVLIGGVTGGAAVVGGGAAYAFLLRKPKIIGSSSSSSGSD